MALLGTDPESYITEYTLVHADNQRAAISVETVQAGSTVGISGVSVSLRGTG